MNQPNVPTAAITPANGGVKRPLPFTPGVIYSTSTPRR